MNFHVRCFSPFRVPLCPRTVRSVARHGRWPTVQTAWRGIRVSARAPAVSAGLPDVVTHAGLAGSVCVVPKRPPSPPRTAREGSSHVAAAWCVQNVPRGGGEIHQRVLFFFLVFLKCIFCTVKRRRRNSLPGRPHSRRSGEMQKRKGRGIAQAVPQAVVRNLQRPRLLRLFFCLTRR